MPEEDQSTSYILFGLMAVPVGVALIVTLLVVSLLLTSVAQLTGGTEDDAVAAVEEGEDSAETTPEPPPTATATTPQPTVVSTSTPIPTDPIVTNSAGLMPESNWLLLALTATCLVSAAVLLLRR